MTSAKLKGSVTSTGGRDATITVYWGDNNASTNVGNWDSNADLGSKGQVALAHDITGLTGGTTYYYAFKGVNASGGTGGTSWSLCKVLQHQHLSVLLFLEIYTPLQILHPPQQS